MFVPKVQEESIRTAHSQHKENTAIPSKPMNVDPLRSNLNCIQQYENTVKYVLPQSNALFPTLNWEKFVQSLNDIYQEKCVSCRQTKKERVLLAALRERPAYIHKNFNSTGLVFSSLRARSSKSLFSTLLYELPTSKVPSLLTETFVFNRKLSRAEMKSLLATCAQLSLNSTSLETVTLKTKPAQQG